MHRTFFGDPKPYGSAEIDTALVEFGMPSNEDIEVSIIFNSEDDIDSKFYGYSAEFIIYNGDNVIEFGTLGYDNLETLEEDLKVFHLTYSKDFDESEIGKMELKHKKACAECPWRKESLKGYLGGHSAEFYTDVVAMNEIPACHLKDYGPNSRKTAMCAGALSVAKKSCIIPHKTQGATEARNEIPHNDETFGHYTQFYKYHADKDYVPYIIRKLV